MVRWLRWHCPPDTGFEIRALAVWGRARYLSVTEAPHNTNFHTWMGKKQFCFFQTAETGNRTPDPGVKGSGANHYPRAPAQHVYKHDKSILRLRTTEWDIIRFLAWGVWADVPPLIMEIANYLHALVMDIYLTRIICGTGTLACGYESGVMSLSDNTYNRPIHVG